MDFLFLIILMAMGAGFSIVIVLIILLYIQPVRNSPAKFFVDAKKNKKNVYFLDDGSRYIITTGKAVDESVGVDEQGNAIIISPNSMKYCMGILMGVGENYRSILTNATTADFVEFAMKNKWDMDKVKDYIANIEKVVEKKADEIVEKLGRKI